MSDLIKNKIDIEGGIEDIIFRYIKVVKELNETSANSLEETERRLKLIHKREILNDVLRDLDIQDFEIDVDDYNNVSIK